MSTSLSNISIYMFSYVYKSSLAHRNIGYVVISLIQMFTSIGINIQKQATI